MGLGRSPFSTAWLTMPNVDSTGDQRSNPVSSSDTQEHRLFWSGTLERRQVHTPSRERPIQWSKLLGLPADVSDDGRRPRSSSGRHQRQRAVPSIAAAPGMARGAGAWIRSPVLPPYSPELNPIERVWKLTRRLFLHNRYFGFLETVVEAVERQFQTWTDPNEALHRLCAKI